MNVTATPDAGYQFDGWSGDASGTDNPLAVTMDANKTITATFSEIPPVQFGLTVNATSGGSVNPSTGTYNANEVVNVTATPDAGYQFDGWSGDASGTDNPLAVTMDANKTITATFSEIPPVQFGLTVNATSGGSVNPSTGTYNANEVVNVTATPDAGYQFDGWSGDASGTDNPLAVTMDANKTIMATFSEIQFGLTVNATSGGSVNPSTGTYNANEVVNVTATPDAGYQFDGWSGDASGTDNPLAVTMDANKTIMATFSEIPPVQFGLTVNATSGGSVNPSTGTYNANEVVNVTATPDAGYQFDGWGGDASGTDNPLAVTMDANKTITATFSQIPTSQFGLTVNATSGGSVNPSTGTYNANEVVNVTATPDAGYQFDGWSGDASGTDNPLAVTMDANKTITAMFSELPTQGVSVTFKVDMTGVDVTQGAYINGECYWMDQNIHDCRRG